MTPTSCPHQALLLGAATRRGPDVAAFVLEALLRGEAAVVIATPGHREAVAAALSDAGVDVTAARRDGRYVEQDARTVLASLRGTDGIDPARFRAAVLPLLADVAGRFGAVAAYGEMVGLLAGEGDLVAALQLEALWEPVVETMPLRLLCGYPETSLDGADAQRVEQAHQALAEPVHEVWGLSLDDGLGSVPLARATLVDVYRAGVGTVPAPDGLADDLALVAAELLGNVVRHAGSDRSARDTAATLCLQRAGTTVTVSVSDGSRAVPVPRDDLLAEGGRGYVIIDALAEEWGVELLPVGKRVWARLAPAEDARP